MKVPIPDDWDGVSWCEYGICWPDSEAWRAILRGFITTPMRGRYWDERSGNLLEIQEVGKQIWLDNIPLREVIMSCTTGQEIADAIRYLANKLGSSGCCGGLGPIVLTGSGVGGTGVLEEAASEIDDTGWTGEVPAGFEDWAEWKTNKCNAASYILTQWQEDIARAQTINFVGGTALPALLEVLAVTLFSPIPGDELIILAGLIILAISEGVIEDALTAIANCLTDNHDDLLCALYMGGTVGAIQTEVGTLFDTCLENIAQPAGYIARQFVNNWMNNDNLNRLFEKNEAVNYPAADCAACEIIDCLDYIDINYGTLISWTRDGDEVTMVIESVPEPGQETRQGFYFQISPEQPDCAFCYVSEAYNGVGATNLAGWFVRCDDSVVTRTPLPTNDGTFCADLTMWRAIKVWNASTDTYQATFVFNSMACV